MYFDSIILLLALVTGITAKTWEYNMTIGWTTANPDGIHERRVLGCNGKWPWPSLEFDKGDRVIINFTNGLSDRNTSMHFHGLWQNGTNLNDGVPFVTQCPIAPNQTYTYNFTLEQSGTYWYHSHEGGQYPDGFRAPLIVHGDDFPYSDDYDEDVTLTICDWYHKEMSVLKAEFLNLYNPTGAEPIPQNLIMNETTNYTWNVEPGKTYLVRLINMGAFISQYFWIEDHNITVVEVDGIYTKKNETYQLLVTTGQRYAFLLTTKNDTSKNYNIVTHYDTTMLDIMYDDMVLTTRNWIVYNESAELPEPPVIDIDEDEPFIPYGDDFYLTPYDEEEIYQDPDYTIEVAVIMDNLIDGINYAFFNNITYVAPKVPTLTTIMTSGDLATTQTIYGTNTHSIVLQHNEIVEIILNNNDTGTHGFHMHGHHFQLIERSHSVPDDELPLNFNPNDHMDWPEIPMKRDTVFVRKQGYIVIRFKADNPGAWIFHCHVEWHMEQGLDLILVEAPLVIQENQTLSDNYFDVCEAVGVGKSGNAAGITSDYLDLTGENVQQATIPTGFTARGIVAMVFSCISGILGIIAIALYGMATPPETLDKDVAKGLGVEYIEDDNEEITEETGSLHRNSTS